MDKKQAKVGTVMKEFKEGKLKSSSGQKVTNPKQAIAIGLSEAGLSKPKKMKEGGMMKPMMKKVAKAEVKSHEKKMHGMAKGGLAAGHKSADGCATKGKTKGKMIAMKKGGYC
jgi:hypothetical protein